MKKQEIPITINFGKDRQIGVAIIDVDALPPEVNYRFEPGFKVIECEESKQGQVITKAELIELSLTLVPKQAEPVPPSKVPGTPLRYA